MRLTHRSSGPPRQGVILLVVVLMLALFLVVGLSFVFYSESAASASRINMEAQNPDHVDVLPETLLSWALGQLIYDTTDDSNGVLSAMRGHSLARTMYGWNYFEGSPGLPNPALTNALPPNLDLTQKNIDPYSRANTMPFNGIGPLRFPPIDKTGNGKSMPLPSAVFGPNSPITDYDLVNYTWNPNDGFVRDPERAALTQAQIRNNPYLPVNPFAGGFNAPYTYPDRTNMFLAAVSATNPKLKANDPNQSPLLLAQSFFRPTGNVPYSLVDPTAPANSNFWTLQASQAKTWWKYAVLRPRPADMFWDSSNPDTVTFDAATGNYIYTKGNPKNFPLPGDPGGDVRQLPGVPFVINGRQVQNDSFWMDLNYPVQISRNGRKFKPLFAFLVLDLDGRLNLNTDGNINGGLGVAAHPYQHASNQGLGRHEINVSKILTAPVNVSNPTILEWPQLYTGSVTATAFAGRFGQDQTPGNAALNTPLAQNNAIADPYAPDLVNNSQSSRSLLYPLDIDAIDSDPTKIRPVTTHFTLPLNIDYTTATADALNGYRSFPQFGPATQPILTGYDNYYFDPNKPLQNPRLNHPLLSQKLRAFGDDLPFGDENMYYLLGGDYRKSYLYGLIPNNLGYDPTNPAQYSTLLGNKNRQLVTMRSFDLDVPGAPPWVTTSMASAYQFTPSPTSPAPTVVNSTNYPTGKPMPTPTTQQMDSLGTPQNLGNDYSDFKASDGRANLLSRIDLNRKLTPYYDATGKFVPPVDGQGRPLPIPPANLLATNFPLAANQNYRYFYATYDRQQLARDIFNRLVQATGAMTPDTPAVMSPANTVIVPAKTGTLHAASGAKPENYNATRWLAQLAVNMVDYVDDDDVITPFQWNPAPDKALGGPSETGWVYGVEAPKLVINEAYCELQNDPLDNNNPKANRPYQYSFWLELYNPMSAPTSTPLSPSNPTTSDRQDPNKMGQDRNAVQFQRASPTPGVGTYPIYQIVIVNETDPVPNAQQALSLPWNTDGTMIHNPDYIVAQVTSFQPDGNAQNFQPLYYPNYEFVQPTTGQFKITPPPPVAGKPLNTSLPSNTGFYVLAPDYAHKFVTSPKDPPGQPPLTPTMYLQTGAPGTKPASGLTYTSSQNPASPNPDLEAARTHTIMLRRLACPCLDPNPIIESPPKSGNFVLTDTNKPFNPYITVDFISGVRTYDAVLHTSQSPPNNDNTSPTTGHYKLAKQRYSVGRVQPYNASRVLNQTQAGQLTNPISNTFFMHNNPSDPNASLQQTPPKPPTATVAAQTNTPPPASTSATMDWPFDWLTFADRPLTNVLELMNVPSTAPHMLTQVFGAGTAPDPTNPGKVVNVRDKSKSNHLAPWTVQQSRIYRALEFFTVGDRCPYPGTSGRVAGKINLNAVFDRDPLDAICDAQPSNFFTEVVNPTPAGAVTDAWLGDQNLKDVKNVSFLNRKQTILGIGTQPDSPFMSLAAPAQDVNTDFQYPTGSGLANTILPYLDPDPNNATNQGVIGTFYPLKNMPANGTPTWPSLTYTPTQGRAGDPPPPNLMNEMLTKASGNVTNRSNTFAVFLTVGFFEVIDDTTLPVKLGAEITTAGGKTLRHQMFAIVDRTNLALATNVPKVVDQFFNDSTAGLRQAPTPPVFMSVMEGIAAGTGEPFVQGKPAPLTVTIAGGLPIDYDGVTPNTFKPYRAPDSKTPPYYSDPSYYQWMYLDMGANQEPVIVTMAPPPSPTQLNTTQLQLLFPKGAQFSHPGGALLCTFQPGNPGPQGPIDYNSPQYKAVVPYTYIIQ